MKKGFTLAEVLITLVIIGVVAAIALPSLMLNNQKSELYSQFMKSYNTLNKAVSLSIADNGAPGTWGVSTDDLQAKKDAFDKYFRPYLSVVQECTSDNSYCGLGADAMIKLLNGQNFETMANIATTMPMYQMADGSAVMLAEVYSGHNDSISFVIDTNGKKGPNTFGKDVFTFMNFDKNGKFASYYEPIDGDCTKEGAGQSCATEITRNGNMDYLD